MTNVRRCQMTVLFLLCAILLAGLLSPLGRTVLAEDWPAECYVPGAYCIGCLFDCSLNGVRYWNVYEGVCTTPTHYPYSGICTGYVILGCQNYCP